MKKVVGVLLIALMVLLASCAQKPEEINSIQEHPDLWPTDEAPVRLRYDRMWGYSESIEISEPEELAAIVDAVKSIQIGAPTDTTVDDYTDVLLFTFEDGGMIRLQFEEQNWVTTKDERYKVEGLAELRELLTDAMQDQQADAMQNQQAETTQNQQTGATQNQQAAAMEPRPTLVIQANEHTFYADMEENSSAEAFVDLLSAGPLALEMHDYGNFEKVGTLPESLPRNDEPITTTPGDVILYQGNQITIYYDENSWTFTRLARIGEATKERLLEAFGEGDVTVKFWIEWSE